MLMIRGLNNVEAVANLMLSAYMDGNVSPYDTIEVLSELTSTDVINYMRRELRRDRSVLSIIEKESITHERNTFLAATRNTIPELGWKFHIDPTAFSVFGFRYPVVRHHNHPRTDTRTYLCLPKMKRFGLDSDRAIDVIIGGVIGGIIGARIYYVLMRWDEYKGDWKAILNTRNGGLAIYGGIIGAILVGLHHARIRKVKALPMLDVVSLLASS